jgi:hypothetical protein
VTPNPSIETEITSPIKPQESTVTATHFFDSTVPPINPLPDQPPEPTIPPTPPGDPQPIPQQPPMPVEQDFDGLGNS